MTENLFEYYFLKRSIEQFQQDLRKMNKIIYDKIFSDDEILELMHNLVGVKEIIESVESLYLKKD
jgi:deoxyadenosine/deoxycytidine kinase